MKAYNFNFDFENENKLIVKLNSSGLSFNKKFIEAIGLLEYISIGLDRENQALAIMAYEEGSQTKKYKFVTEKNRSYVNIGSKKLIDEVRAMMNNISLRRGIELVAVKNKDKFVIDLTMVSF